MSYFAKLGSFVALGATILPALLYYSGTINHDAVKGIALVGTIGWFVASPLWLLDSSEESSAG